MVNIRISNEDYVKLMLVIGYAANAAAGRNIIDQGIEALAVDIGNTINRGNPKWSYDAQEEESSDLPSTGIKEADGGSGATDSRQRPARQRTRVPVRGMRTVYPPDQETGNVGMARQTDSLGFLEGRS